MVDRERRNVRSIIRPRASLDSQTIAEELLNELTVMEREAMSNQYSINEISTDNIQMRVKPNTSKQFKKRDKRDQRGTSVNRARTRLQSELIGNASQDITLFPNDNDEDEALFEVFQADRKITTAKKHRYGKSSIDLNLLNNSPMIGSSEKSERGLASQVGDAINENPTKFLRHGDSHPVLMHPFKNKLDKHGQFSAKVL